jgi:Uma2 family endonuclease
MTVLDAPPFRFTRAMYDQMVEAGILEDQRVEFIDGEILQMSPIHNPHVTACSLLTQLLYGAFGPGAYIRVQAPLAFHNSEPQPDIAVIAGSPRDYTYHPATALLVVEIADSSLRFDRKIKNSLYASARIPEYWILNLRENQLEVHRSPKRDRTERFGFRYTQIEIFKRKDSVVPLAAPKSAPIRIADMLP